MTIPESFQAGLIGGLVIGFASVVLMISIGRIAGISGIAGSLLQRLPDDERAWRLAFLAGLVGVGVLIAPAVSLPTQGNFWLLGAAGLLVGFGTRLGSGCTSGHGVCGLARRSLRSLTAVVVFMLSGFITVYFLRHGGA
ncbi:MAG: YeeE/YedE family protein [Paraperlucidibaca sp.]